MSSSDHKPEEEDKLTRTQNWIEVFGVVDFSSSLLDSFQNLITSSPSLCFSHFLCQHMSFGALYIALMTDNVLISQEINTLHAHFCIVC
jgi:hypothetical protein